jgi:hypothetical protein
MQLLSKVLGQNLRNILATQSYWLRKITFLGIKKQVQDSVTFNYMCPAHSIVSWRTIESPTRYTEAAYE